MKKSIYALLAIIMIASCETNNNFDDNNYNGGVELTYFTGTPESRNVILSSPENSDVEVEIGSTVKSNNNRSYTVSVTDESPTQEGAIFQLNSTTTVIPAGEYIGSVVLNIDFEVLPDDGFQVELALSGDGVATFDNVVTVNVIKLCPIPGDRYQESTWNVVSTVCYGDASGNCDPANSNIPLVDTVIMTAGEEVNQFMLSDITGGLYGQEYNAADQPGMIVEICERLILDNQPDTVYGGDFFNGEGEVILNEEGNIVEFTIVWSNGYGDAGTSTFTPAN